jgi:16S rRNA G1207 methylase RsmC
MNKIERTLIALLTVVSLGGGLVVGGTAHDFVTSISSVLHK